MTDILLVVNAGSSSLKFQVYRLPTSSSLAFAYGGQVSRIGAARPSFHVKAANGETLVDDVLLAPAAADLHTAQHTLTQWLVKEIDRTPVAVGHRIVHGGARFIQSEIIDDNVLRELEALAPLAPLHQHNNLAPVHVIREHWPQLTQVACFDTAFHHAHDEVVKRFAIPQSFYDQGVRRYGFHGLSYDYIAQTLRRDLGKIAQGRVIVAHMGSGASACAMKNGRSVDTTMGFTALDGLPMSTRPGRLDAGVVLWMLEQGYSHDQLQDVLYNKSGLKGLSGLSGDTRDLLASDTKAARLAIDYLIYRSAESLAGLCAATGGLDALVFTAGVGENSPEIRSGICERLKWIGIIIDAEKNLTNATCISASNSQVPVYVLPTNEESVIAHQTLDRISG